MSIRLPVRRYLQGVERTQDPAKRFGSVQWILARPLYRFKVIDLAQVPPKNRAAALQLELRQWTPFAHTAYCIGWGQHCAYVWGWDNDKVGAAMADKGLKPGKTLTLPESALHTPMHHGVRLVKTLEGFEGQYWRNAFLQHSRWWPQLPDSTAWLSFQRDAGLSADDQQGEVPAPRPAPLEYRPWTDVSEQGISRAEQLEHIAMAAGAIALLVPTAYLGSGLYKIETELAMVQTQKTQIQMQAAPLALARSDALDAKLRSDTLSALSPFPQPLVLMAKVAQTLPADKSFLKDWSFDNGLLKFTVAAPTEIPATELIERLQQSGAFKDVKALPGRDPKNVTFEMTLASASTT